MRCLVARENRRTRRSLKFTRPPLMYVFEKQRVIGFQTPIRPAREIRVAWSKNTPHEVCGKAIPLRMEIIRSNNVKIPTLIASGSALRRWQPLSEATHSSPFSAISLLLPVTPYVQMWTAHAGEATPKLRQARVKDRTWGGFGLASSSTVRVSFCETL